MSWSFDPAVIYVPAMWLDAAVSDPADCPVCVLADSADDCLAHWTDPTTDEINADIRASLARLA